jgi:hypothetical protein
MNIDKVKDALIAAESLQEKLNEITDSPDTDDGSNVFTCQQNIVGIVFLLGRTLANLECQKLRGFTNVKEEK